MARAKWSMAISHSPGMSLTSPLDTHASIRFGVEPRCAVDKSDTFIDLTYYKGERRTAPAQHLRIILTQLHGPLG